MEKWYIHFAILVDEHHLLVWGFLFGALSLRFLFLSHKLFKQYSLSSQAHAPINKKELEELRTEFILILIALIGNALRVTYLD